jgi:hypothetical protein
MQDESLEVKHRLTRVPTPRHVVELYEEVCRLAEDDSPALALVQARKAIEALCQVVVAREQLDQQLREARAQRLDSVLPILMRHAFPSRLGPPLKTIQSFGNYGAHFQNRDDAISREQIAPCLLALEDVIDWFLADYLDADSAESAGLARSKSNVSPLGPAEGKSFSRPVVQRMAELRKKVDQLTEEQYQVLHDLRFRRRALISGCAGSGKTLIAAEKAIRLDAAGLRTLVLCHNPILARHLQSLVRSRSIDVSDFSTFVAKLLGEPRDTETVWTSAQEPLHEEIERAFSAVDGVAVRYDAVIVDEGQDFREEWWLVVEAVLEASGGECLYIFCDDNQALLPHRSSYPITERPISLSRNCRNAGNVFEIVRKFHRHAPLTSAFLRSEGVTKVTAFRSDSDMRTAVRKALRDAADHCALAQVSVLTNEPTAEGSQVRGLEFSTTRGMTWRDCVLEDLENARRRAITRYTKLQSGSSQSELANRFRIPAGIRLHDQVQLPSLSSEALPQSSDVVAIRTAAAKLSAFFEGAINKTVRFDSSNDGLRVVALSAEQHRETRPNLPSRLWLYSQPNWATNLPTPPPRQGPGSLGSRGAAAGDCTTLLHRCLQRTRVRRGGRFCTKY